MAIKIVPIDAFNGKSIEALKFLAYLTSYSDNYESGWNDVKYAGRSEKFYIFTDFKRNVNIEFNIPCFNKDELIEKHTLLNKLVSILAGQYNNNFLGGVISKITLGNYLVNQPGIINNLNYSPLPDSPWDIDAKLAHYIKVSFGFTVIHDFLPEYGQSFIYVNGAQSDYAKAKQKQLQLEEEEVARTESERQRQESTGARNVDSSERVRPNVLGNTSNTIPNSKIESVKNLQTQVIKQEQAAKKTAAVQARKSVGKSVPKKEEEKPVKIGGMPIPYPKETQFNALIGGIKPSQNSPYSTANQLNNSKALAQAEKQATQAFLNKAGAYKTG